MILIRLSPNGRRTALVVEHRLTLSLPHDTDHGQHQSPVAVLLSSVWLREIDRTRSPFRIKVGDDR